MRKIKFRTWDNDNLEYAEHTNRDPFFSTSHSMIFFWERDINDDGNYTKDIVLQDFGNRFILEQYTGIKDKNGIEIYEGDIIKYEFPSDAEIAKRSSCECKNLVEVRWSNDCEDNSPGFRIQDLWGQSGTIEVVGNIHENYNLLSK